MFHIMLLISALTFLAGCEWCGCSKKETKTEQEPVKTEVSMPETTTEEKTAELPDLEEVKAPEAEKTAPEVEAKK